MRKSLIVAGTEFANFVRTKAFIISIVLAPVLALGMIVMQRTLEKQADTTARRFAIVDHTGVLGSGLERAAADWNARVSGPKPTGPRFLAMAVPPGGEAEDDVLVRLSEQVRNEELFAFVEIPAVALQDAPGVRLRYYSNHPTYETLPRWIEQTVSAQVVGERFRNAAIDPALVQKLMMPVGLERLGLLERDARGGVRPAREVDNLRAVGVPMILMMLIFMPVMIICPQLVQSVVEEKMSRISEVLLGSVTPFELMLGKLLGAGAVCVVITMSYVTAAAVAAVYWGYADVLRAAVVVEFLIFLSLAMLFYGALYIAVGSASTSMKDSQGLMTPVMLLSMMPVLVASPILRAPDGALSVTMSLFPPTTPYLMMFRMALDPGPPLWQVFLSIALTSAASVAVIWAASRIFRVGLLMQGKTPSLVEMVKWVRA